MSDLETIVRPFQLPDSAPSAQPSVTPDQPSNPPVFLQFGRSGVGKTFGASYSSQTTYYQDQQVVEKSA